MKIRFLEIAQSELDGAVEYYNSESPGLGDQFLVEVLNAVERIKRFPEAWHLFSKNTRRCQTRRFPFGVIYQILEGEILIVAIANLHRKPDYWHSGTEQTNLTQRSGRCSYLALLSLDVRFENITLHSHEHTRS